MSESKLREALIRLTTDPEFAAQMEKDPAGFASDAGLTGDELARLQGAHASKVDPVDPTELLFDAVPSDETKIPSGTSKIASDSTAEIQCNGAIPVELQCNGLELAELQCNGVIPVELQCNGMELAEVLCNGAMTADVLCNGIVPAELRCNGMELAEVQCNGIIPVEFVCNGVTSAEVQCNSAIPIEFVCDGVVSAEISCNALSPLLQCNQVTSFAEPDIMEDARYEQTLDSTYADDGSSPDSPIDG